MDTYGTDTKQAQQALHSSLICGTKAESQEIQKAADWCKTLFQEITAYTNLRSLNLIYLELR